jgi:hypothetical protein
MSDYFDRIEGHLLDAVDRRAGRPSVSVRKGSSLPLLLAVGLLVLAMAAGALAAAGVFRSGSAVRPVGPLTPSAGIGVPAPGGSRLLSLSAPDPAGGLPWGMRLVHTTRGLVCLQIGRLYLGRLVLVGRDGAFGDDGLVHELSADAVGRSPSPGGLGGRHACQPPESAFAAEEFGVAQSGLPAAPGTARSPLRSIVYGLLGPEALSLTYKSGDRFITQPVEQGTGAFLIVLPGLPSGHQPGEGVGSYGFNQVGSGPSPSGVLTDFAYRYGTGVCHVAVQQNVAHACHERRRPPVLPPETRGHLAVHVTVTATAGARPSAVVWFVAPYEVSSALSSYQLQIPTPCHKGTVVIPIERDVRRGETVTTTIPDAFGNACGRRVQIDVAYHRPSARDPLSVAPTILGHATITTRDSSTRWVGHPSGRAKVRGGPPTPSRGSGGRR